MKKNALIVDDSRLACKVMANMLETFGIQSFAVYSAEEALDYLQQNIPDIIFLDHTMPGMDGLETIKVIKSNPMTATVPVMMYTAKQGDVYVGQARALGAVDVLPKGLEKDYLYNALEQLGLVKREPETQVEKTKNTHANNKNQTHTLPVENYRNNEVVTEPIQEDSTWQKLWLQKIEPYLNRQKAQQLEELQRYNGIQTRKLTREFHQTLEHFEHAMVHRMESHDEFVEAKEEISRSFYKKAGVVGALVITFLLTGILWQLWTINQQNSALQAAYQEGNQWRNKMEAQFQQLGEQFTQVQQSTSKAFAQGSPQGFNSVSLVDESGSVITELLPVDLENGLFRGKTDSGYQFVVNAQGELGWPMEERYYLTDNCTGDAFVNSPSGTILKESNGRLWYVDKQAPATLMTVNSHLLMEGKCATLAGEILRLHLLHPNQALETGLDELQTVQLYFSR
ncbi:response regulator [Aliikangiella maris]|uniref:Response regulator n=2 Tax=Aliikangiella maris TaxID=3162458 RepID=A0ABV2BS69_9GAMM